MIRLRRHRHGKQSVDITDYAESFTARNSVRGPWGSVSARLVAPVTRLGGIVARGDVLVVTDDDEGPLGWGIVPSVSQAHTGGDAITMRDRDVQAISWLDYLGEVEVVKALGRSSKSVGTLFNIDDWWQATAASLSKLTGDVGPVVAAVVRVLARVRMPETLGGSLYGEEVRVVYDTETAHGFQYEITTDPVLGPSTGGFQTTMPSGGQALSMLMASVGGDSRMVEMFPTFVPAPAGARKGGTADALGALPILVHRLVPWRHEPLDEWERKFKTYAYRNAAFGDTPALIGAATAAKFADVTWPTARHHRFKRDTIFRVDRSESSGADYNAATVGFPNVPDSPTRFQESAGLPIIVPEAVDRYGLRVFDAQWPFYTHVDGSQTNYLNGLAWQGAQWHLGGGRFQSGSVSAKYTPKAMHGESFTVPMPEGLYLEAYADAVTHSVSVSGDTISRDTTVQFSRGVVAEPGGHADVRSTPFPELR